MAQVANRQKKKDCMNMSCSSLLNGKTYIRKTKFNKQSSSHKDTYDYSFTFCLSTEVDPEQYVQNEADKRIKIIPIQVFSHLLLKDQVENQQNPQGS